MTYVVCDACERVGLRIHSFAPAMLSHPSYHGVREYHCEHCGAKLRVITHREYHTAYMRTGKVGA